MLRRLCIFLKDRWLGSGKVARLQYVLSEDSSHMIDSVRVALQCCVLLLSHVSSIPK
jgi:hypothetical protein